MTDKLQNQLDPAHIALLTVNSLLAKVSIEDIYKHTEHLTECYILESLVIYGNRQVSVYVGDDDEPYTFSVDVYGDRKILVSNF